MDCDQVVAEERAVAAWCQWLDALATDAGAALSASLAYGELDGVLRDHWLDALAQDRHRIRVPLIAIYAPLLAVEKDPVRRARIQSNLGPQDWSPPATAKALLGRSDKGARVGVIVSPLYLDFVQVLACSWRPRRGFEWVRHEPFLERREAPSQAVSFEGTKLDQVPLKSLIDELAYVILEHERLGLVLPEELRTHASLFQANPLQTS